MGGKTIRGFRASIALVSVIVACGGESGSGGNNGSGGASPGGSGAGATGASGGGPDCTLVDCALPDCADDEEMVVLEGSCCPSCRKLDCSMTPCPDIGCGPDSEYVTKPGECCGSCAAITRPDCSVVDCAAADCTDGKVGVILPGDCCQTCVDDPKACDRDEDCLIADRPRSCCGCPEAVHRAALEVDACWYDVATETANDVPAVCQPEAFCEAVCSPCVAPGTPRCDGGVCVAEPR